MAVTVPVAGAIVPLSPDRDPLVVESAPESEATRGFKNVARYVFRFVQAEQWAGNGGAVSVRVVGERDMATTVAANVGLLLAPLLDIGIGRSSTADAILDVADDESEYPNPRHRVWLVPEDELPSAASVDRYGLTIGPARPDELDHVDLALVLAPHGGVASPPAVTTRTEIAAVVVDAPSADHPDAIVAGS